MLDDVRALNALALELASIATVRVRWHPRQPKEDVALMREALEGAGNITLSDPAEESVEDYLSGLACIVAGDSSILLEAAIAGCGTIYHRTTDVLADDYYGFVGSRLAHRATRNTDVLRVVSAALRQGIARPDPAAIRDYSETYGSPWRGRESELVASVIAALLENRDPGPPFVRRAIAGAPRFQVLGLTA
jgi:hypothetical protein